MRVGVDQAGGNNVPCGIKNAVAFCVLIITDADDFSVVDGYVRFGVEFVLRSITRPLRMMMSYMMDRFPPFALLSQYTRFFHGVSEPYHAQRPMKSADLWTKILRTRIF